eukprot:CAMPEP_0204143732 /NCGR_PEP_ID=MMETSP0361-20130328/20677_1 /ASSEMBLY_ACC=CAM_ASM_000343 /TAXON_ID=268821 /ORGANISM="Scrippsiella Hangoei, Strain SHTV-5" /LENGTH=420 /DNA_ID=CAMNT_0051097637 /DNA_START=71 /DNA_END=1334 /DNA_ORIENTATION=+
MELLSTSRRWLLIRVVLTSIVVWISPSAWVPTIFGGGISLTIHQKLRTASDVVVEAGQNVDRGGDNIYSATTSLAAVPTTTTAAYIATSSPVPSKTTTIAEGPHKMPTDCQPYPGKRVVLVTANEQYVRMFSNWLIHAAPFLNPETDQLVVAAESKAAVAILRNISMSGSTHFDVVFDDHWGSASSKGSSGSKYGSPIWANVVTHRPRQILNMLELGCSVLYNDIDTAWIKPVFAALDRYGRHDLMLPDDNKHTKGKNRHYLCTCLMYFRPTTNNRALLLGWAEKCKGETKNQFAFNTALSALQGKIDYVVLPETQFPPGVSARKNLATAVMIHANWMVGTGTKEKFLESFGFGIVDRVVAHVSVDLYSHIVEPNSLVGKVMESEHFIVQLSVATHSNVLVGGKISMARLISVCTKSVHQ